MTVAALVVAIVSALAAIAAVVYARRLGVSAERVAGAARESAAASAKSAAAAESAVALDRSRRHDELTPRFRVSVELANPGVEALRLSVFLAGPSELGRLDALTVTIRDDHPWRADGPRLAGGPSAEEVAAQIWGPYRFVPGTGPGADSVRGVPGADATGRETPTRGMPVGESLPFALEPTWPPSWSHQAVDAWRRERGTALRLQLECSREGWEPWTLTCEVDTVPGSPAVEVP